MDDSDLRPIDIDDDEPYWAPWDDQAEPPFSPFEDAWDPRRVGRDRLRFVALIDGRVVDTWTEPHVGTRWERHASAFDRAQQPPAPPPPPDPPRWQTALTWLDSLVGGRAALEALDDRPLTVTEMPADLGAATGIYQASQARLDEVAASFFDDETRIALHRGLGAAWQSCRPVVTTAASPAHTAASVCWVIGKANGLFAGVRQLDIQRTLGITSALSTSGQRLAGSLRNVWSERAPYWLERRDLMNLGRADLLLSSTRRDLIRARDLALDARAAYAVDRAAVGREVVLPS